MGAGPQETTVHREAALWGEESWLKSRPASMEKGVRSNEVVGQFKGWGGGVRDRGKEVVGIRAVAQKVIPRSCEDPRERWVGGDGGEETK